jgi:Mn-dependent DtxR family transcriptional regulator
MPLLFGAAIRRKSKKGAKMTEGEKELVAGVKRVEDLLTILVRWNLAERLSGALKSEKERAIYGLTGLKTQPEIAKVAKVSARTVTNLWTRLEEQGLLRKVGQSYGKMLEDKVSDS